MKFVGLKTCDTCRKARKWLDENKVSYDYVDVRTDGVTQEDMTRYLEVVGSAKLVNKSSTTWRGLDDETKSNLTDDTAVELLLDNPTLMKRPIFDLGDKVIVGFKTEQIEVLSALI